jgi:hypothetical protein
MIEAGARLLPVPSRTLEVSMSEENESAVQDTLLLAGGVALIAMGVGMLMTNPALRRSLLTSLAGLVPELNGQAKAVGELLPDVERYMKLRNM